MRVVAIIITKRRSGTRSYHSKKMMKNNRDVKLGLIHYKIYFYNN